jgi:hypothetical protein
MGVALKPQKTRRGGGLRQINTCAMSLFLRKADIKDWTLLDIWSMDITRREISE